MGYSSSKDGEPVSVSDSGISEPYKQKKSRVTRSKSKKTKGVKRNYSDDFKTFLRCPRNVEAKRDGKYIKVVWKPPRDPEVLRYKIGVYAKDLEKGTNEDWKWTMGTKTDSGFMLEYPYDPDRIHGSYRFGVRAVYWPDDWGPESMSNIVESAFADSAFGWNFDKYGMALGTFPGELERPFPSVLATQLERTRDSAVSKISADSGVVVHAFPDKPKRASCRRRTVEIGMEPENTFLDSLKAFGECPTVPTVFHVDSSSAEDEAPISITARRFSEPPNITVPTSKKTKEVKRRNGDDIECSSASYYSLSSQDWYFGSPTDSGVDVQTQTSETTVSAIPGVAKETTRISNECKENNMTVNEMREIALQHLGDSKYLDAAIMYECAFKEMIDSRYANEKCETIYKEGNIVSLRDCTINFPKGAVSEDTKIKMSLRTRVPDCPEGLVPITPVIELTPNMTLRKNATVKIATWCTKAGDGLAYLYYKSHENSKWEEVGTASLDGGTTIEFEISKFCEHCWFIVGKTGKISVESYLLYHPHGRLKNHLILNCKTSKDELDRLMDRNGSKLACDGIETLTVALDDEIAIELQSLDSVNLNFKVHLTISENFLRGCEKLHCGELLPKDFKGMLDIRHTIYRKRNKADAKVHKDRIEIGASPTSKFQMANFLASDGGQLTVSQERSGNMANVN